MAARDDDRDDGVKDRSPRPLEGPFSDRYFGFCTGLDGLLLIRELDLLCSCSCSSASRARTVLERLRVDLALIVDGFVAPGAEILKKKDKESCFKCAG